ncbi:MAG: hypothetical protein SFV23_14540 [Planctomycetaceae bacterium]|nr:hypothetical protein [Planctomycetaceae bacterium]
MTLLIVLPCVSPAACAAADIDEAIGQLRQWRESLVSLRVRISGAAHSANNRMLREGNIANAAQQRDWIWDDSGRFRDESTTWNDGQIVGRDLRTADVSQVYICGFSAKNRESPTPSSVTIRENAPQWTTIKGFMVPIWPLWDDGTRTWLVDRLQRGTPHTVTDEGLLQVTIEAGGYSDYQAWLDPKFGYLPRRGALPSGGMRCVVEEFQEVEPGFWFPRKGETAGSHDNVQTWEVTSVERNIDLRDALFVPPMGPETRVINTITGQNYWHGGQPPAHLKEAAVQAAQTQSPPVNSSPPAAHADQPGNWTPWLVLCGVALVSLGVWLKRRG